MLLHYMVLLAVTVVHIIGLKGSDPCGCPLLLLQHDAKVGKCSGWQQWTAKASFPCF
jgi:hypothetical protein